jgi:hypothetical protein
VDTKIKNLKFLAFFFSVFFGFFGLAENSIAAIEFYVDPDFSGSTKNGSAQDPWSQLNNSAWSQINDTLANDDVSIYFSCKEAGSESNELATNELNILRTNNSARRLILSGNSFYNANDSAPDWQSCPTGYRYEIRAGYPINTAEENRNYVTVRGFKSVGGVNGYGGQSFYYSGGDHVVIEQNEITHDPSVAHGALFQFGYAHLQNGRGNGEHMDITIRDNIFHDSRGECLYFGGSENTGLPAHSQITIEKNTIYNCGIFGDQGDCIDVKDGNSNATISNNICHDSANGSNVNGINVSAPKDFIIDSNKIWNIPDKGVNIGTYWGNLVSNVLVSNNVIFENGTDGIYLATDTANKPIDGVTIANNTITENDVSGILVGSGENGSITNITIANNTITKNNSGLAGWGSFTPTLQSNNVYGNANNYSGPFASFSNHSGALSIDPGFVSPASFNFQLSSESPLINTGISLSSFQEDAEDIFRPQGSAWDIGAYEYTESGGDTTALAAPSGLSAR